MRKKTFILAVTWLLLFAAVLQAAITEKYVSSAGAGTHAGTSEANAFSWAEMITDINAGGKAGNRYNVIRGGGAIARTTTTDTVSGSGTSTSPIIIRGYLTVITDGFQGRISSGPLVTTNFCQITYTTGVLNITGSWVVCECLDVAGARSGVQLAVSPNGGLTRSKVVNSSTNAAAQAITVATSAVVIDNDLALTGASGGSAAITAATASGRILGNRINGGPAMGVNVSSNVSVVDNLIYSSTGIGISVSATGAAPLIYGNTIVQGGGDGIDIITGTTVLQCVVNNMITDNTGNGIDGVSAANAIFASHNRTRDNGAADNSATDWLAATKYSHVTTDTGSITTDYVDPGSTNYQLISTSPAKGVGHFNYRDIGAYQRQESTGSRSRVVNP